MPASALAGRKYVWQFEYDFAKDGGAVGDISLRGGNIPAGAVIDKALVHVQTACTSDGSATIALTAASAGDVKAAVALTGYTAGVKACVPVGTAATSLALSASAGLTATVAVAALTAGKMVVVLEGFITA